MHDVLNEVRCEQKGKKADRKKTQPQIQRGKTFSFTNHIL